MQARCTCCGAIFAAAHASRIDLLQGLASARFPHASNVAGSGGDFGEQRSFVAYSTSCLAAASINSQVKGHGLVLSQAVLSSVLSSRFPVTQKSRWLLLCATSIKTHSYRISIHAIMKNGQMKIQISELSNTGDARGFSFTTPPEALDFLGRVADIHLASTVPGAVRGNHYHLRRREAIVILPGTAWSLHWDEGEGMAAQHRTFDGSSAVLVLVSPGSFSCGAQRWLERRCGSWRVRPSPTIPRKR